MTDEGPVAGNNVGFFLKSNDGSLVEFTKANHLSDINISALDADGSKVYVGYANGNIDIVDVREFTKVNIPEFKNYTLVDDKTINRIYHHGNFIYCSTNSGLLVVNVQKQEIVSRYIVDKDAVPKVNASVVMGDSLYVATSAGLYRAPLASRILENSSQWTLCDDLTTNYCDVTSIGGLIVAAKGSRGGTNEILVYRNGKREHFSNVQNFRNLSTDLSTLLVTSYGNITLISQGNIVDGNYDVVDSRSTCHLNESRISFTSYYASIFHGEIVIADANRGLMVVHASNNDAYTAAPNGPDSNNTFELLATRDAVYCTAGGVTPAWNPLNRNMQVHRFKDGQWASANAGKNDALRIAINPLKTDSILVSSWGSGIYKYFDGKLSRLYTGSNSGIKDYAGRDGLTWIGALTYDSKGNLFASNALVSPGMTLLAAESGLWTPLDYMAFNNTECSKLIFTSNGHGWVLMPHADNIGTCVFDINGTPDDNSDDIFRSANDFPEDDRDRGAFSLVNQDGEVFARYASDIVEDKDGIIWLTTENGLLTFRDDKDFFDIATPVFHQIKVPRNDGTNFADYLLDGIDLTAIALDGANRKWIGTRNDGVYLVSADGLETIYHFNADNSPLFSNEIRSIAVSPSSGEVYIATYYGIISFHGDATEPEQSMSQISVYPNPVRPAYNGSVTMNGFTDGAYVKITDINGRLLYSTRSVGGSVIWNCRNLDGQKASTGVYVVWAVSEDGKEKAVARIAVVK